LGSYLHNINIWGNFLSKLWYSTLFGDKTVKNDFLYIFGIFYNESIGKQAHNNFGQLFLYICHSGAVP
jgi:hypothetical protein